MSLVCIGFYLAKNSLEGTAEVFDNLGGSGFDHKRFNPTANAALLGFFVVLGADGVVNRSAKLKKYFFGQQWTLREAVNRWLK